MTLEGIEKLRTAARNMAKGRGLEEHDECNLLLIIADEIEREIAERYMELPVDADGVPIHVGENLRSACSETEYTTLGFWFDFDCGIWQVMVSSKQAMSGNMLRHVKPRTVEDVLMDVLRDSTRPDMDNSEIIEKYVAELRMAGDVE